MYNFTFIRQYFGFKSLEVRCFLMFFFNFLILEKVRSIYEMGNTSTIYGNYLRKFYPKKRLFKLFKFSLKHFFETYNGLNFRLNLQRKKVFSKRFKRGFLCFDVSLRQIDPKLKIHNFCKKGFKKKNPRTKINKTLFTILFKSPNISLLKKYFCVF